MFCQQSAEEPERLFFAASAHHEGEAHYKVHRLAITDVFVIDSIGLQDVTQSFLTDTATLTDCKERVRRECPVQILVYHI